MIKRQLQDIIEKKLFQKKAIVLIGARQVGKSTLFQTIVDGNDKKTLFLDCDDPEVRETLTNANTTELKLLIADNKIVFIDEAQRVENIGLTLKIITDRFPECQLLVTGSSAFDLSNNINEPLTGRKYEYNLFPISTNELLKSNGLLFVKQSLESRLIYGSYPDVLTNQQNAKELLMNLSSSYLYKDILKLENIRKPELLDKLLVALALQVGSEVSYNEVGQTIGTDSKTVEKYIGLLERCFVIFRLNAFSRNVRTELKKSKKIFFYDNGIRNAIIQNFSPLALRNDKGALWENFFISERIKRNHYSGCFARVYFWRTSEKQEIDYIEEENGKFRIFELKASPSKGKTSFPSTFTNNYNIEQSVVITPDNYIEYLI